MDGTERKEQKAVNALAEMFASAGTFKRDDALKGKLVGKWCPIRGNDGVSYVGKILMVDASRNSCAVLFIDMWSQSVVGTYMVPIDTIAEMPVFDTLKRMLNMVELTTQYLVEEGTLRRAR